MDDIVTSSLKGLMEAFQIDGGALAYMVADLPAIRSLSALSDSMSTRALLSCNMPTIVYFAALLSFNVSERNMLSFDFPRTDRFSQIVSRWKILWSFTTAWASSTLWNQCSTDIDENMWLHMVWRKGKISLRLDCMSQESRWTYICGIEDFRVSRGYEQQQRTIFFRKKRRMKLRWGRATFGTWVAHSIMGSICYENISIQGCGSQQSRACNPRRQLYARCFRCSAFNDVLCVCVCCVLFYFTFWFRVFVVNSNLLFGWLELWPKNSGCIGPVGSNLCMRTEGGWFFKELS